MNYKDFDFWNKEKLWKLRKEICLGSLYIHDYENSFGVPEKICCDFFDGFLEWCWTIESEEENGLTKLKDLYKKYDNADELWDYFYGMEYPFGDKMTIKELKANKGYYFHCDINKKRILEEIANTDCFDEWGCAYVSLGETMSVEYNLCIDNTTNENINESAIYKVDYDEENDYIETDTSTFIHYEIDFDNPKWKKELEDAMCEALIEFFGL